MPRLYGFDRIGVSIDGGAAQGPPCKFRTLDNSWAIEGHAALLPAHAATQKGTLRITSDTRRQNAQAPRSRGRSQCWLQWRSQDRRGSTLRARGANSEPKIADGTHTETLVAANPNVPSDPPVVAQISAR